jgi:tetratricopeptide (TPR) repeat protein
MARLFTSKFTKVLSTVALTASLLAPAVYSNSAMALTVEEREARKNAKTRVASPKVGKKVGQAFELYGQELVDDALTLLLEIKSNKDFDMAYVNRFVGNLYATMDGRIEDAIKYTLKAYEPDVLNYKEQAETIKLLGQLYMMTKQYDNAIKYYKAWMEFTGEEDAKTYVRIANGYYEQKKMDKVIEPADKAIELAEEVEPTPYILKLAAYFERKMYPETVKMGETLVKLFPEEKRNWTQLGMFYVMVEDYTRGLSTMELAYKQGYLEKASEFKTLAQMYSQNDLPIKAALLQEKYIKLGVLERTEQNLKALANYFLASKEMLKAAKYFGEAAKIEDKASLYKRQGEMLFQAEKYSQAAVVLSKALDLNVKKKGSVNITLMQAYFYTGKYRKAYAALNEANKYPSAKSQVRSWRQYIKDKAGRHGVKL